MLMLSPTLVWLFVRLSGLFQMLRINFHGTRSTGWTQSRKEPIKYWWWSRAGGCFEMFWDILSGEPFIHCAPNSLSPYLKHSQSCYGFISLIFDGGTTYVLKPLRWEMRTFEMSLKYLKVVFIVELKIQCWDKHQVDRVTEALTCSDRRCVKSGRVEGVCRLRV